MTIRSAGDARGQDATSRSGRSRSKAGFVGFLFGSAGMFATMYSTQAILPELGRDFGVSPAQAGLTVSAPIVALAVGAWIWGPLSDRWGRKRCLVLAAILVVFPTLVTGLAPSFEVLLAIRVLQGLCMPGLLVIGPVYVIEAFGQWLGGRAMGYYLLTLNAGGLIARTGVALASEAVGWRLAIASLAVLPCIAAVLMYLTLPDAPAPQRPAQRGLSAVKRQLGNSELLRATAGGCALFFTFVGVFSFITYRLEAPPFDLSPTSVGLVFLLWTIGVISPFAGGLADRAGWRTMVILALAGTAITLVLSLFESLTTLIPTLALLTVAMFVGSTSAKLGSATSSDADRGVASAIYFSCYYVSGALAGFVPGLAWERFGWPGVAGLDLIVVGAALVVLLTSRRKAQHK